MGSDSILSESESIMTLIDICLNPHDDNDTVGHVSRAGDGSDSEETAVAVAWGLFHEAFLTFV